MINKKFIIALLPLAFIASHNVFAEEDDVTPPAPVTVSGGTVQFSGSIVNAPCVVDIGGEGLSVDLGQYRAADFTTTGDVTSARTFNINLDNCATETYSKAALSFNGTTAAGNNKALSVSGGAGGVGIQILKNNTALVVDGTESSVEQIFNTGSNTIPFQAQYISLENTVTPGAANATANFTVTYQ